ncbi:MAG: PD-(D/E)XK nuclease family protein [Clostridiaceae bacterium]|nr:PD-(D/E)XK nuclease family protein [Clostridiaceae bacterium]
MKQNNIYLSNSNMQVFMNCRKKYRYKYIEKKKSEGTIANKFLSFGNSIHSTLAQFNKITSEEYRNEANLHKLLRRNWIRDGYESIEEEREYGLRGLNMLSQYCHDPKDQGKENLIIEEMIKKDMGAGVVLTGKLDKVYLRNDNLIETIDYKTGAKVEPIGLVQLPIYILLTQEKLGCYPDIVSYYYLSYNYKMEIEVTDELINEVKAFIEDMSSQISDEKEFPCKPNEYCNVNCEFFEKCVEAKDFNSIIINIINSINEEMNNRLF